MENVQNGNEAFKDSKTFLFERVGRTQMKNAAGITKIGLRLKFDSSQQKFKFLSISSTHAFLDLFDLKKRLKANTLPAKSITKNTS